jgi:hypothetical protein
VNEEILSLISKRHRQLLVHSYIYYVLGQNLIQDYTFDMWRRELVDLHKKYPEESQKAPYYDICKGFDDSPSGYWIRLYPDKIISTAYHLLDYEKTRKK